MLRLLASAMLFGLTSCGLPEPAAPAQSSSSWESVPARTARPSRRPAPAASTIPITDTEPSAAAGDAVTRPERFRMGAIDLPVVPVGVRDDGMMELPGTVQAIGWYAYGARPADGTGTIVLAGHVDTRAEGLGPLAALRAADRGTEIRLSTKDGKSRRYRVSKVAVIRKTRLPLAAIFARDGEETLVVITCGGPYDRRTGYRDNVVLTARPTVSAGR